MIKRKIVQMMIKIQMTVITISIEIRTTAMIRIFMEILKMMILRETIEMRNIFCKNRFCRLHSDQAAPANLPPLEYCSVKTVVQGTRIFVQFYK